MKPIFFALFNFLFCLSVLAQTRIEFEHKLAIPEGKSEELWTYLKSTFTEQTALSDEHFEDTYYDTSDFAILDSRGALRRRKRINLTNSEDRKHGRSLIQLKLPGGEVAARKEIKFEVKEKYVESALTTPLSVIIKDRDRGEFVQGLESMKLTERDLSVVFTLMQRRRRIYISRNNQPLMTLSLDQVEVRKWLISVSFEELEIEINEKAYTAASETERLEMKAESERVLSKIQTFMPMQVDQSSKYQKSLNLIEKKLPCFRMLIRYLP